MKNQSSLKCKINIIFFILVSQPPGRGGVNPVGTKYQVFFKKSKLGSSPKLACLCFKGILKSIHVCDDSYEKYPCRGSRLHSVGVVCYLPTVNLQSHWLVQCSPPGMAMRCSFSSILILILVIRDAPLKKSCCLFGNCPFGGEV